MSSLYSCIICTCLYLPSFSTRRHQTSLRLSSFPRPCEHWWGRVGIHDDREPQVLAFCKRWDVIWSWLPVVTGILLMAENLRQLIRKCQQHGQMDHMLFPLLAFGSSIFPIFYNHWMLFMYVNDHWYGLFPVQLLFTVTDNLALLLRFSDALPEARAAIHGCHLLFLFGVSWRLSHLRVCYKFLFLSRFLKGV